MELKYNIYLNFLLLLLLSPWAGMGALGATMIPMEPNEPLATPLPKNTTTAALNIAIDAAISTAIPEIDLNSEGIKKLSLVFHL